MPVRQRRIDLMRAVMTATRRRALSYWYQNGGATPDAGGCKASTLSAVAAGRGASAPTETEPPLPMVQPQMRTRGPRSNGRGEGGVNEGTNPHKIPPAEKHEFFTQQISTQETK